MGFTNLDLLVLAGAMTVVAILPVLLATTQRRAVIALALSAVPALMGWVLYALSDGGLAVWYAQALSSVLSVACLIGVVATGLRLWRGSASSPGVPLTVATACLAVFWVTVLVAGL